MKPLLLSYGDQELFFQHSGSWLSSLRCWLLVITQQLYMVIPDLSMVLLKCTLHHYKNCSVILVTKQLLIGCPVFQSTMAFIQHLKIHLTCLFCPLFYSRFIMLASDNYLAKDFFFIHKTPTLTQLNCMLKYQYWPKTKYQLVSANFDISEYWLILIVLVST